MPGKTLTDINPLQWERKGEGWEQRLKSSGFTDLTVLDIPKVGGGNCSQIVSITWEATKLLKFHVSKYLYLGLASKMEGSQNNS